MNQPERSKSEYSAFELSKWYLDCVSDAGDALVVYFAELRWRALTMRYANMITCRGSVARGAFTLRGCAPPSLSGNTVTWRSRTLGVAGSWTALAEPLRQTVLACETGAVDWECIQPKSAATVQTGDGPAWNGLGYVERLQVTVPPWRMPIQELRWGRFHSETDTVVWIDWRGAWSRRLVFHNGAAVNAGRISDDGVALADEVRVEMEDHRVLREGLLGSTVLAGIPKLARIVPGQLLEVEEIKWLSRASLRRPGAPAAHGWAIHEVVRWPR